MTEAKSLDKQLAGQVALVAGATRGAGRETARALAEAGAIAYCTGRSTRGGPSPYNRPETIEETAETIKSVGGNAIPLRIDHTVEVEVKEVFERIEREQGRLDVLVNSIAGEDPMMGGGSAFWNTDLTNAEALIRQAVVSRVLTATHAARLMVRERRGLIVDVTENNLLLSNDNGEEAGKADRNFLESESPLFVGRAVVALATDPSILERTGQVGSGTRV